MTDWGELKPYLNRPNRLSPTRTELAARCYRRHVLSDLLHLTNPDQPSPSLGFGTAIHRGVASFWRELTDDDGQPDGDRMAALTYAKDVIDDQWVALAGDSYMTLDLALLLMDEYAKNARLAGNLPGSWRLVELEQRREIALGESVISYEVDRLLQEGETGALAIFDTKTASKLSPLWRRGMEESIQQRIYHSVESQRLGQPIEYLCIEGVQKKVTPGQIEYVDANLLWTPEFVLEARELLEHYARRDLDLIDMLQAEDPEHRWEEMLDLALTDPEAVPFNYMDCESYYSKCDYYEICHSCPTDRPGLVVSELELDVYPY